MLPGYNQTGSIRSQPFLRGGRAGALHAINVMTEAGQTDSLLLPFVCAADGADSERLLAVLVTEHAEPIVKRIIGYKMRGDRNGDESRAEDVRGEVMLQLVQRLHNFRADYANRPIRDFAAYVAAATYNACDRYVSRKYPQRRRLKSGLRYLLTHRPGFALWQAGTGAWVAGLHEWRAGAAHVDEDFKGDGAHVRLRQLCEDARVFARRADAGQDLSDPRNAFALLNAVFDWTAAPVELDLLTGVVAEWWGVGDESVGIEVEGGAHEGEEARGVQLADSRPQPSVEAERRAYLGRLWREIIELPPRQRAALLLNLRDEQGRTCVDLWTLTGVATTQAVAAVLGMTVEEFAELWNELPLEDKRIAAHLGLTRQQVINLRKSARARLARRMKDF
jgi:RNA polymerase sigma factor (sigma-70 family)